METVRDILSICPDIFYEKPMIWYETAPYWTLGACLECWSYFFGWIGLFLGLLILILPIIDSFRRISYVHRRRNILFIVGGSILALSLFLLVIATFILNPGCIECY